MATTSATKVGIATGDERTEARPQKITTFLLRDNDSHFAGVMKG